MKKLKLSEKKLLLFLNFAERRFLNAAAATATAASTSGSNAAQTAATSQTTSKHRSNVDSSSTSSSNLNQETNSSSSSDSMRTSISSMTYSLYQEYQKYYSYIWDISSRLSSTSSGSQGQQTSSSTSIPKRLDLNDIIKPLIDLTGSSSSSSQPAVTATPVKKPPQISYIRSQAEIKLKNEARLVELSESMQRASSLLIKSELIAELFKMLYAAPELRLAVDRRKLPLVKQLVELRELNSRYALKRMEDKRLTGNINQCLSLLGYFDEADIKHAGVNILTLDGGGAKGFVAIEVLKNIERHCGKPIHQVFDYICGTSTGACLAALIAIYKLSLDEIERQYKLFVKEIFSRNRAAGLSNLVMSYSYYDTQIWEKMLQEAMGDTLVINSAKESNSCKISIVSNMTTANHMKIFLFRNYNLPPGSQSQYEGTCRYKVWQAIRASTAAPVYHEDFKIDGYIFYDGGVLANNPTALALHEARLLWPNQKQPNCVVSIGNGRFQPALESFSKSSSAAATSNPETTPLNATQASSSSDKSLSINDLSLRQKINRIVAGVSSTETVHNMLVDMLPHSVYYRFNPYLSEEFSLDENRPNKWRLMQYETSMYMRRNKAKFEMAAKQLCKEKSSWQKLEGMVRKKIRN